MIRKWLLPLVAFLSLLLLLGTAYRVPEAAAQEGTTATISGRVQVQGATSHDGVTIQLGLDTAVAAADGSFSFSDVQPGIYTLSAHAAGYLTARAAGLDVNGGDALDLDELLLLAGDVNGDGVVEADDFDIIIAEFGNSPPSNSSVDYSGDDRVDVRDLVLAAGNRGKSEAGATVVDSATLSGMVIGQEDGTPLRDVSVTVQVDVNGDGAFAPVGQGVLLPGLEQILVETSQQQTDLQGSFTFEAVPFLINGAALSVLLELQKEGHGTFSQGLTLAGNTVLSIPMALSVQLGDEDLSDGIQLVLTGSPAEVEIDVPSEAIPPGVTSVTGLINFNNPRDSRDLFPGNYRAADPDLGEVQLESTVFAQIDLRDQDGNAILDAAGPGSALSGLRLQVPLDQYPTLRDMTPENPDEVNVPLYSFDYEAGIWRPSDQRGRLEAADGSPINQDQLLSI
jgi:hypothetical protein